MGAIASRVVYFWYRALLWAIIMQLEDYFIFLAPNDIRLKGTRIGIETIWYDYIYRSHTPEEFSISYLPLT